MAFLYLFLDQTWKRFVFYASIAFSGIWMGLLSRKQWYRVDELMYQRTNTYQSPEHNLRGFFAWEEAAMQPYFENCKRVLVIGAGGGREVLALSKLGIEVVGYECNRTLATYAQNFLHEQGCSSRIEFLERDAIPPPGAKYDGVIIGWGAYMLMMGRKHRIDFVHALSQQMESGAPILLSFFTRNGHSPRFRVKTRIANFFRVPLMRPKVEIGDDLGPNYLHRFTEHEVKQELIEAGFQPGHYRSQQPGPTEPGYAVGLRG